MNNGYSQYFFFALLSFGPEMKNRQRVRIVKRFVERIIACGTSVKQVQSVCVIVLQQLYKALFLSQI